MNDTCVKYFMLYKLIWREFGNETMKRMCCVNVIVFDMILRIKMTKRMFSIIIFCIVINNTCAINISSYTQVIIWLEDETTKGLIFRKNGENVSIIFEVMRDTCVKYFKLYVHFVDLIWIRGWDDKYIGISRERFNNYPLRLRAIFVLNILRYMLIGFDTDSRMRW